MDSAGEIWGCEARLVGTLAPPECAALSGGALIWNLESGDWELLIRLVRTLAPPECAALRGVTS